VDAALGVCCIRCQLMIMTWRDRQGLLNFVFCYDGRGVNEKERDGGWRWEWCAGYVQIWKIRGMTCLLGLGRPCIGVITCQIRTRTCWINNDQFTCTQHFLKSQFLMMISPCSFHLSRSGPQLYHHLRTWSEVIALYCSISWSRVNTKYSIHWVPHTPSKAYTEFSIHHV